jgi:hypothetical protein
VEIVKVAFDSLDEIVTVFGTEAIVLLLINETVSPPLPANPFSEIVPADVLPPATAVGLSVNDASDALASVRVAFCVIPLRLPEIVAFVAALTPSVPTTNVTEVLPAGILTFPPAGRTTAVLEQAKDTLAPLEPAGPPSVRVPDVELPPTMLEGFRVNDRRDAGVIVNNAVAVVPPPAAEIEVVV